VVSAELAVREAATGLHSRTEEMVMWGFDPRTAVTTNKNTFLGVPASTSPRAHSCPPDDLIIDGKVWLQLTMKRLA
jgi:hypothetical protein